MIRSPPCPPRRSDGAAGIDPIAAALPHGQVTVKLVKGGLDVPDEAAGDAAVIATAAVTVRLDLA